MAVLTAGRSDGPLEGSSSGDISEVLATLLNRFFLLRRQNVITRRNHARECHVNSGRLHVQIDKVRDLQKPLIAFDL